ncbi:MAG: hypothetical protein B7Z53_05435, partial [Rhodospirillales bacterium 12-71-4]
TLNTPLASGQTVEIVAVKEGGPSLDWLNGELGYLRSSRAKTKVRAWFNALYQVLLGQPEGPRFGGFVALYGIAGTIGLIETALERPEPGAAAA